MIYQWQHWLRLPLIALVLPVLYWQGKRVKRTVVRLPEASEPEGKVIAGNAAPPFQLLFIGESTVAGVGLDRHANGMPGTLAKLLADEWQRTIHWRVVAKSGYTATKVCERLVPKLAGRTADRIVVGLGGNDAFALRSPGRWRCDVRALIQALRKQHPKAPILFANMPPIHLFPAFTPLLRWVLGGQASLLGRALADEVELHENVTFADEYIELEKWKQRHQVEGEVADFFSDGVHPSPLTYQVWGRDLARWL